MSDLSHSEEDVGTVTWVELVLRVLAKHYGEDSCALVFRGDMVQVFTLKYELDRLCGEGPTLGAALENATSKLTHDEIIAAWPAEMKEAT